MTAKMCLAVSCCLLFAACATSKPVTPQPRQFEGPRPQQVAPPTQPAQSPLKLTLPEGWQRSEPGAVPEGIESALMNETLQAAILVIAYPSAQGAPRDAAAQVAASLADKGATVSEIQVSADGQSASFTWQSADKAMGGKMIARVLADLPKVSLMFMGVWPPASDAKAAADLDAIAASARVSGE